jgi:predicted DNA-binding transcriptional regulator AlpA
MSIEKPLVVDWKGLKRLGWPYSRAHTWRMMFDPDYAVDPFPRARKLGKHRNAHVVWRVVEVLAYFEAHDLRVSDDWQVSSK